MASLVARVPAALRRRLVAAPPRVAYARRSLARRSALDGAERRLIRAVSPRVSLRDAMYGAGGVGYLAVGLSAVRCVEQARRAADLDTVNTILDLPSGHGRVMRWLAARFPQARLTACDIDRDGVDWCARVFGATPAYSAPVLDDVSLGESFDLIWCGSLATHLDAEGIRALLRLFERHLAPGGVAVVTTHGAGAVTRMRESRMDYLLAPAQMRALIADYERQGFGYADYPDPPDYGVSLTTPDWVRAQAGALREVYFRERGWDDHQDVFGFVSS